MCATEREREREREAEKQRKRENLYSREGQLVSCSCCIPVGLLLLSGISQTDPPQTAARCRMLFRYDANLF